VSDRLPELLDAKRLSTELGVTRAAAEAIMRRLPTVQIEDLRQVSDLTVNHHFSVGRCRSSRTFAKVPFGRRPGEHESVVLPPTDAYDLAVYVIQNRTGTGSAA
jgi:hypothetical protein